MCNGVPKTGEIEVTISGTTFPVLCDMDSDGGGWVVILQRKDGSVDFETPLWDDYAHSTIG